MLIRFLFRLRGFVQVGIAILALGTEAAAQSPAPRNSPQPLAVKEQVEVVATRIPETTHDVPAAIEVIDGDTLRATGATHNP